MKKLLIAAGVIALTATTQVFAQENMAPKGPCPCPVKRECARPEFGHPGKMHKPHFDVQKFEQELKLTDAQKEQAKQLRDKSEEIIKPIAEKIKAKHQEMEAIFNERLTVQERQEKLAPIHKEIKELKGQIRDIRIQGKKDFEALLTDKQLKKLETMKPERKDLHKFEQRHHRADMHRRPPMPIECGCNKKILED